jgi:hypothetical protein
MVIIRALEKVTFGAGVGFRSPQHPLRARVVAGSSTDTNSLTAAISAQGVVGFTDFSPLRSAPTNYRVRTSLLILSGRRDFAFRVRVPMGCRLIIIIIDPKYKY